MTELDAQRRLAYLSLQAVRPGEASHAHVWGIVRGLEDRGWVVDVIVPPYTDPATSSLRRLRAAVANAFRLLLRHRRQRFHAVYVRSSLLGLPAALLARLARLPTIQEVNGPVDEVFVTWPITRRLRRPVLWAQRAQLRWAACVVAVTPELAAQAEACGARRTETIANAADTNVFRPGLPGHPKAPDRFVIFFGEFAPWQGIDVLLDAAAHERWPSGVQLVLAGDGEARADVERAASASSRVVFVGRLPQGELAQLVAGAIAGVSPQTTFADRHRTGVSPIKVYETMASGVPVIVSDVPGPSSVVHDARCGLVVPAGDAGALAAAVGELADDPDHAARLGAAGRQVAVSEHSWDARSEQTDRMLRDVLALR